MCVWSSHSGSMMSTESSAGRAANLGLKGSLSARGYWISCCTPQQVQIDQVRQRKILMATSACKVVGTLHATHILRSDA